MLKPQRGMTLIELIAVIVILGVAVVSVMAVFGQTVVTSAEVKSRVEAVAIAEALMNKTLATPYASLTSTPPYQEGTPLPSIVGVSGVAVTGYEQYSARVDVAPSEAGYLGNAAKHITVTVQVLDPVDATRTRVMNTVVLEGYRSNRPDGWL